MLSDHEPNICNISLFIYIPIIECAFLRKRFDKCLCQWLLTCLHHYNKKFLNILLLDTDFSKFLLQLIVVIKEKYLKSNR